MFSDLYSEFEGYTDSLMKRVTLQEIMLPALCYEAGFCAGAAPGIPHRFEDCGQARANRFQQSFVPQRSKVLTEHKPRDKPA